MKFVCQFVGGHLAGEMPLEKAELLTVRRSEDLSRERAQGALVHRAELDNRPKFSGYAGPMWNGTRRDGITGEDIGILRYETWEVYDMLSR